MRSEIEFLEEILEAHSAISGSLASFEDTLGRLVHSSPVRCLVGDSLDGYFSRENAVLTTTMASEVELPTSGLLSMVSRGLLLPEADCSFSSLWIIVSNRLQSEESRKFQGRNNLYKYFERPHLKRMQKLESTPVK